MKKIITITIIILLTLNLLLVIFNLYLTINKLNNIYTYADLIVIKNYIMEVEGFDLSDNMIKHYDLNNDGQITSADYVILNNKLNKNN